MIFAALTSAPSQKLAAVPSHSSRNESSTSEATCGDISILSPSSILCRPDLRVSSSELLKAPIAIVCITQRYLVVQPALSAYVLSLPPPNPQMPFFPTSVFSVFLSSFFFFLQRWKSLNSFYTDTSVFCFFLWNLETSSMLWMTHVTLLAHPRKGVEVLMDDLQVPTDEFSYGRSKIFIRNPRTVQKKKCMLPLCRWSWVWLPLMSDPVCPAALCFSQWDVCKAGWAAL